MNKRIIVAVIACVVLLHIVLRRKEGHDKFCYLNYLYSVLLFSVHPIVFSPIQGYYNMGTFKGRIWAVMTVAFLIYELGLAASDKFSVLARLRLSPVHVAMIFYLVTATISFLMAEDKMGALMGASGWFTGLLFQYGLVAVFFSISLFVKTDKRLIYFMLISAILIFAIGVLHRFLLDPIGIYSWLNEEDYPRFLSTIGQATWYSSYLCLIFPVGLHLFVYSEEKRDRYVSGAFISLSAATLVTQNSDTAYLSFFAIFVCYFIFSMGKKTDARGELTRLGQVVLIKSAVILLMGILERIFADSIIRLDELSVRMAQGVIPVIGLMVGAVIIYVDGKKYKIKRCFVIVAALVFIVGGIMLVAGAAADVYFTPGRDWGNGRGLIWIRTWQMYRELPLINKLFGIGPGMFYSRISNYTELILANAHNEWMTAIVEYGIVGGISYLAIFVVALEMACRSIRLNYNDNKSAFAAVPNVEYIIIAATIGYVVHGFFNYQQCISTPMMFALFGTCFSAARFIENDKV